MAVQEPRPPPGHSALCRALSATSRALGCCRWMVLQAVPQGPAGETGLGIKGRSPDSLHRLNGRCPFHRLVEWEGAETSSF